LGVIFVSPPPGPLTAPTYPRWILCLFTPISHSNCVAENWCLVRTLLFPVLKIAPYHLELSFLVIVRISGPFPPCPLAPYGPWCHLPSIPVVTSRLFPDTFLRLRPPVFSLGWVPGPTSRRALNKHESTPVRHGSLTRAPTVYPADAWGPLPINPSRSKPQRAPLFKGSEMLQHNASPPRCCVPPASSPDPAGSVAPKIRMKSLWPLPRNANA